MSEDLVIEAARYLTTENGARLLDSLASVPGESDRARRIERAVPGDIALRRLALSVVATRRKATERFGAMPPFVAGLLFTEEMLAQASSPGIARYHARGLSSLRTVSDLGCGAGIDSIAIASAGARVLAVESHPVHRIFARYNATLCGVADRIEFREGDALETPPETEGVFADPARRDRIGNRVSRHADLYSPSPDRLAERIRAARGGCLKLSPLLPDDYLLSLGGRVAFLSEGRECKEACVWFGDAGPTADPVSAQFVETGEVVTPNGAFADVRPVGAWVLEPDPAVIRAGTIAGVAERLNAGLVSPEDVYLTADRETNSPLARAYAVLAVLPFRRKEVAAFVRKANYGRVIVKKRRARMEPDAVLAEIKASNRGPEPEVFLILVREPAGHTAIFCTRPVPESADAHL
ncbi:MAG: hypothetical protein SFU56_12070 [Capsulimonadales bacterium]|nr:hypothetical protein [Capsulimonadales bacterium]